MATFAIKARTREIKGKKVKKLREQDLIPAVLYGHGIENQNLTVNSLEFKKLFDQTGESKLIDLQINDKKPVKILIHDIQFNPLKNEIDHIDFYQIKEGEKITTEIELEFVGESPAVKELAGVLVKNYDAVEIECLPSDLEKMDKIEVDLSGLKTFEDTIHIKDLKVPSGVKIMVEPEEVVALITQIQEEKIEEIKPIEEVEGVVKEGEAGAAEGEGEQAKEKKATSAETSAAKEKK
ncbi:MAG: hypothetical protein A2Y67_03110 [Candidatus Buchananbacteria bacterium RBG_13_39_9]|uniref:Large ribosomal subunit protein bL25 n=1 Tax=Candidatus Buchananbacteria bacterium RBG_13_39_9 TaxID=1797531 RepID=A0A1G1XPS3_9BACT|nr:MAG: hypothetical protein A2Y67_03110 [Candidatus Buchananbacteria bacterium RBG_13_39_9]